MCKLNTTTAFTSHGAHQEEHQDDETLPEGWIQDEDETMPEGWKEDPGTKYRLLAPVVE